MISAVCIIEVEVATAFCSIEAGTMFGNSAAMVGRSKATTAPSTVTATRMPAGVSHCCRGDRQHQRRHRFDQLADKPDAPPVEPVGDMADDEGQHRHRQELAQADEAERKGAVCLIVDHPSHGDANGLEGERGKTREAAKFR